MMMCPRGHLRSLLLAAAFAATLVSSGSGDDSVPRTRDSDETFVRCRNGAVVTVSEPASEAGLAVLKRGGNAVDAAVATAFALAVTYPAAGNIGGGGYMIVVPADGAPPSAVDFREVAPAAAAKDMFVDPAGRTPHRRVGVPGTVRGLWLAHAKYGLLRWSELVAPAVVLAREGFVLDQANAESLNELLAGSDREQFAELHRVFAPPSGRKWTVGDRLRQPDLAATLERIASRGPYGFYAGRTAELVAAEMKRGGGLITLADLAAYRARWREPVQGTYRGHTILSSPPSSSGGTVLVESLNILENFELRPMGRWSPECLHLLAEASRRAYRDRARYLGDPDRIEIPLKLTQKDYAAGLARSIDRKKATPSAELAGDIDLTHESEQTTHFSVVDQKRMAVSLTYTLENSYGSRVVVSGAGFLLNDEMNDFNWLPGVTDTAGRIGTEANLVAPGKRMLSSMCPTIVLKEGKPLLVTGSPGGRTIINTVLGIVVSVVDFDIDVRAAVDAPRQHQAWMPDRLRLERLLQKEHPTAVERLKDMGHAVDVSPRQGDAHSLWIDPATGEIAGAADRRIHGSAKGW